MAAVDSPFNPALVLCGLALISLWKTSVDLSSLRTRNHDGKRLSYQDLRISRLAHPQIRYGHLGESPNWQLLSYSGIVLIAILTWHEGGVDRGCSLVSDHGVPSWVLIQGDCTETVFERILLK